MAVKRYVTCEFLKRVALLDLTATDYKVLLLLLSDKMSQAEIARCLGKQSQNVNRSISNLKSYGIVEVDSVDGRSRYYKVVMTSKSNSTTDTVSKPDAES